MERAVLALLLDEHPTWLTIGELTLAFDCGEGFAVGDAVDRAVRELASAGLLRREGDVLAPTRPALYFDGLGTA